MAIEILQFFLPTSCRAQNGSFGSFFFVLAFIENLHCPIAYTIKFCAIVSFKYVRHLMDVSITVLGGCLFCANEVLKVVIDDQHN